MIHFGLCYIKQRTAWRSPRCIKHLFFWISLNFSLISICHATLTISSGPEWSLGSISEMERGVMEKSNTPNTDWVCRRDIGSSTKEQSGKQAIKRRKTGPILFHTAEGFFWTRTCSSQSLPTRPHTHSVTVCWSPAHSLDKEGYVKRNGDWEKGVRRTFSGSQKESPGLREGESKQLTEGSLNRWDLWKIMKMQLAEAL